MKDKAGRSDAVQKTVENTKTGEEEVIDSKDKKAFEKQDKKCRAGSMKKKLQKTSRLHAKKKAVVIVESKLSREDSIASEEARAKDNSRTNSGNKDADENPDRSDGIEMEEVVETGSTTNEEVKKAVQTNAEEKPSENLKRLVAVDAGI